METLIQGTETHTKEDVGCNGQEAGYPAEIENTELQVKWCRQMARRFRRKVPRHYDSDSLEGVCWFGIEAAKRLYRPDMGCSFKTFAYSKIQYALLDWLRARQQKRRKQPVPDECSLESAQIDVIDQTDVSKDVDDRDELEMLMEAANLNERERELVRQYYHEGATMRRVGEIMGVSESSVCNWHAQALSRLRSACARFRR